MLETKTGSSQAAGEASVEHLRDGLRTVAKRQWWMWSSAFLITILLAVTIASFAFPELMEYSRDSHGFELGQAVRGLIGLVLLFDVYAVYQQVQLNRMQLGLAEQCEAIGRIEERTDEVFKLAALDPLTGLYNRRSGEQRLAQEITRAQRHKIPLTVLICDLNGLKSVNDSLGHAAGDEMIRYFANRLARASRGSDVAVRLGGDEFMLVLPECRPSEVLHILGRLTSQKIDIAGQSLELSFSAGWADYISGELPEDLLKRADSALYVNKRSAKAQIAREGPPATQDSN